MWTATVSKLIWWLSIAALSFLLVRLLRGRAYRHTPRFVVFIATLLAWNCFLAFYNFRELPYLYVWAAMQTHIGALECFAVVEIIGEALADLRTMARLAVTSLSILAGSIAGAGIVASLWLRYWSPKLHSFMHTLYSSKLMVDGALLLPCVLALMMAGSSRRSLVVRHGKMFAGFLAVRFLGIAMISMQPRSVGLADLSGIFMDGCITVLAIRWAFVFSAEEASIAPAAISLGDRTDAMEIIRRQLRQEAKERQSA